MAVKNAPSFRKDLPRIACIGAEALTHSHGTGLMFSRHLARYPRSKIVDVHYQALATNFVFPKVKVPVCELRNMEWNDPMLADLNSLMQKGHRRPGTSFVYQGRMFGNGLINWDKLGGTPDLIYSTCYSARDFAFLHHIYRNLPKKVPIVQHFLDLDFNFIETLKSLYKELEPAIVAVWALNESIRGAVRNLTGNDVKIDLKLALHQPVSRVFKQTHRGFCPDDFSSIMIGNVWSGTAYLALHRAWSDCQDELRGLPPIEWMGHSRRFRELAHMGFRWTPGGGVVENGGYLSSAALKKALVGADLAIIPFSGEKADREDYNSYSLPSRLGDYCMAGLPVVVISQPNTEPARYVRDFGLGIVVDPAEWRISVKKLKHFILDRDWREECGTNARRFAERTLDLESYQDELYPRLTELARARIPSVRLERHFFP
ncbi:MAG: hypothetical protein HY075_12255 [Deltaproteobacteria bacterium]|nr:hypothetical protein [Deltaproteobacteria bacterium]